MQLNESVLPSPVVRVPDYNAKRSRLMNQKLCLLPLLAVLMLQWAIANGDELEVPPVTAGEPAAGVRVRQVLDSFRETQIHHVLYLPTDWKAGEKYPVIVEYAGNRYQSSLGTVEGCSLGYGLSGGVGVIWVCLPFVDLAQGQNSPTWWGDVQATVDYCLVAVGKICEQYGGNRDQVFIAGFSRGSIACNYIGLNNDEISKLWRGFICHSHYDGVRIWPYPASDRDSAAKRLARLGTRPQFICQENSTVATQEYLAQVAPNGRFTFVPISGIAHTDTWVLNDLPARTELREWFRQTLVRP